MGSGGVIDRRKQLSFVFFSNRCWVSSVTYESITTRVYRYNLMQYNCNIKPKTSRLLASQPLSPRPNPSQTDASSVVQHPLARCHTPVAAVARPRTLNRAVHAPELGQELPRAETLLRPPLQRPMEQAL